MKGVVKDVSRSARIAAALLLVAAGIGAWLDPHPPPLRAERAGYQVVEADLHVHTRFSDGFLSPFDVVWNARRQGLGAIAITEHNVVFPSYMARAYSELVGGPSVIIGEEITTRDAHLLAFGIERTVSARLPTVRAIDEVHAQGGVVVAAHPVARYWPALDPVVDRLDGVELLHPIAFRPVRPGFDKGDVPTFWERSRRVNPRLFAIGSSDYHVGPILGLGTTLLFAESASAPDLLAALRAGRTVIVDPQGAMHGDAAMIAALKSDPLPDGPPRDLGWKGQGWLDTVGRVVALVGLVMLVALRRTRDVAPG
jgi:hypothetical protein